MRRPAFYSRTPRVAASALRQAPVNAQALALPAARSARSWWRRPVHRRRLRRAGWALLVFLVVVSIALQLRPPPRPPTQKDIDAAVLHTLSTHTLPSPAARAAEAVRPSVVRVESYMADRRGQDVEQGVGTGVVVMDKGLILTNLHVVRGATRLRVVFADGSDAGASVVSVQAQNDLAVLQAQTVPDDLRAATLRGTRDLRPGDQVVAVGFPFGIGPSVSAGVISGFDRSFRSPEGEQEVEHLIQFDAAANPGNSGGPLVTLDGEVVGVVTGILNPTRHRTFLGIGFAVPIESAASAAGLPPF